MATRLTQEQFLERVRLVHGNTYDYSKVEYKNSRTKVIIICSIHGEFHQKALAHLQGHGCANCVEQRQKISFDEFVIRANIKHNCKYQYIPFQKHMYVVQVVCPVHGTFEQNLFNHLNGNGCQECFLASERYTNEIFIEKSLLIHTVQYNYSKTNYINSQTNVIITCENHGDFEQMPAHHLQGVGCPKCANVISKSEIRWLDSLGVPEEFRHKSIKLNGRLFKPDAVDLVNKIIYEFYGDFWHGNPQKYDPNTVNPTTGETFGELYAKTVEKEELLMRAGYKIVSIWESDLNSENIK